MLLESASGVIVWFSIKQRTAPDLNLIETVAQRLDEASRPGPPRSLAGILYSEDAITLEFLDQDIKDDAAWDLTQATQRALVDAVCESGTAACDRDSVINNLISVFNTRRSQFLASLRTDILKVLCSTGLRPSYYNYLVGGGGEQSRNRVQALSLYPILARSLLAPNFDDIRCVIDHGAPLVDALAHRYAVPRSTVRILKGDGPLVAGNWPERVETLLQLLRDIPPSWWPQQREGWQRFTEATQIIAAVSGQAITTTSNRLLLRDCARRGYALQDFDASVWQQRGRLIDDFMRCLRQALVFSWNDTVTRHVAEGRAVRVSSLMLAGLGIDRVTNIAQRWSAAYRRAQESFAVESELWRGARWPGLIDGPVQLGDLYVHPLTTSRQLSDEGRAMSNCVATYVDSCLHGKCQIWSLRSLYGSHVATLETLLVRTPKDGTRVELAQLAGPCNANPSPAARMTTQMLLRHIADHPEAMRAYVRWSFDVAQKAMDVRMANALIRPILSALNNVLPSSWSLDTMLKMGKKT